MGCMNGWDQLFLFLAIACTAFLMFGTGFMLAGEIHEMFKRERTDVAERFYVLRSGQFYWDDTPDLRTMEPAGWSSFTFATIYPEDQIGSVPAHWMEGAQWMEIVLEPA